MWDFRDTDGSGMNTDFPILSFMSTLTTVELVSKGQAEFLRDTTQRPRAFVQTNYARSCTLYQCLTHNTQR